jgi:hypothetical protein
MCSRILGPLFLIAAASGPGLSQEKSQPNGPLGDLRYLQNRWGLQLKSSSINPVGKGKVEIAMLLEFDRELTYQELAELHEAMGLRIKKIRLLFQDADNVIFNEASYRIDGEISGMQGDAIRLRTLDVYEQTVDRAKKLIVRYAQQ